MQQVPHDATDLVLAPVALQVDEQLERLAALDPAELAFLVALETDHDPRTPELRRTLLLEALTRDVEMRGWELAWDPRGLRLHHDGRQLVLGLPASVQEFLGRT